MPGSPSPDEIVYFESADAFRAWLETNHASASELWVGYHKKGTGRPSVTHPEAVDEALCFGWIDGVRKSVDAERFTNRFTPRTARSIWSQVNIRRVAELTAERRMQPAGLAAFEGRDPTRQNLYSNEQRQHPELPPELEEHFKGNAAAWEFWLAQPPGYRKTASWWVISAKRDEIRWKRLGQLIHDSESGRRIALLTPASRRKEP